MATAATSLLGLMLRIAALVTCASWNIPNQQELEKILHHYIAQRDVPPDEVAIVQIVTRYIPDCLGSVIGTSSSFPFPIFTMVYECEGDSRYAIEARLEN